MSEPSAEQQSMMALALSETIKPMFVGMPPAVAGAALADLLAMWVAGHIIIGDPRRTQKLREQVIREHINAVRPLIKTNEAMLLKGMVRGRN